MISFGANSLGLSVLAAAGALLAAVIAGRRRDPWWLRVGERLMVVFAVLVGLASLALLHALYHSDFRLAYVASYTERALPTSYRLAAFWAGQEGSLLLWAGILAVMNLVGFAHWRKESLGERATLLGVLAVVSGFFVALMLFAADPFRLSVEVPADGHGLNPLLQDWAMILHPPATFLGYAGFTIPMAMFVAVLVAGRSDNRWLGPVRWWVLFSWLTLGIGILLGGFWAYVELGWGGYWAWDPVENASLLPWLTSTALLHSIIVQQQRGMFKWWNANLILGSFLLCIFGTFLTRSGIVESVHTFGSSKLSDLFLALVNAANVDPKELIAPLFMLFLLLGTGASAALLIWRRRLLEPEHKLERLVSREGAFLAGNVLLVVMTAIVLVGTIFPVITSTLIRRSISLGPSFYNQSVVPVLLVLIAMMAAAPLLSTNRQTGQRLAKGLPRPMLAATAVCLAALLMGLTSLWALACLFIGVVATLLIALDVLQTARLRQRHTPTGLGQAILAVVDANHRRYGGLIVHLGVVLMMAGVAGSSLFGQTHDLKLSPHQSVQAGAYTVSIEPLREVRHGHFTAVETTVRVQDAQGRAIHLTPQTRFYDKARSPYAEIALYSTPLTDVYINLAGWDDGGRQVALQLLINPLTMWIWIGSIVLCLGATLGLLPRLIRRAAARTVPAPTSTAATTTPVTANYPQTTGPLVETSS